MDRSTPSPDRLLRLQHWPLPEVLRFREQFLALRVGQRISGVQPTCSYPRPGGIRFNPHPTGVLRSLACAVREEGLLEAFERSFPDADLDKVKELSSPEQVYLHRAPKEPEPAMSNYWSTPSIWNIVIQEKWARPEHINTLEAWVALMAARHASRETSSWGKKILVLADSKITQGALSKGRSSSPVLLRLRRRLASLELGLRMKLRWRFTSTNRNCPNSPSQGRKFPGCFLIVSASDADVDLRRRLSQQPQEAPDPSPLEQVHPIVRPSVRPGANHPIHNRGAAAWENAKAAGLGKTSRALRPPFTRFLAHAVSYDGANN